MASARESSRLGNLALREGKYHDAVQHLENSKAHSSSLTPQEQNDVDRALGVALRFLGASPHAALGIDPYNSSRKDVKKAYRALARKYHPDKCNHTGDLFHVIHTAYETLRAVPTPRMAGPRTHATPPTSSEQLYRSKLESFWRNTGTLSFVFLLQLSHVFHFG